MIKKIKLIFFFSLFVITTFLASSSYAQLEYAETIAVLRQGYYGEIQAQRNYLVFAGKAEFDKYHNIANLFISLAASEEVHAKNFKKILNDLGVSLDEPAEIEIKVSRTKENLKYAVGVELSEIDKQYPGFIKRIENENYAEAIKNITYAWEAEKQHRGLIEKIRSNIGIFFGIIARKIESSPTKYFVCATCGSTVIELPQYYCPICKGPVSAYREVTKI